MSTSPLHVAVGILFNGQGDYLLAQRPAAAFYGGWWEFPGGKIEKCETPKIALQRELQEELGITITEFDFWLRHEYAYEHGEVALEVFKVHRWSGEIRQLYHQSLHWQHPQRPLPQPLLPANIPLTKQLA